jgi:MATE family multidrug resistance protein
MIRTLCLIFAFGFFTTMSAKHSDTILAANSVLLNFITFAAFVLDGFANATEVYAGRAVGLKNRTLLSKSLLMTGAWSVLAAVVFSLSYALFAEQIIALMTDIPAVIATAQQYQVWVIAAPLIAVWSYVLDGLFVGATRGIEMRNTMLFATFLVYLPSWWLFSGIGNHGLWLALLLFLAARGISQALLLRPIFASVAK